MNQSPPINKHRYSNRGAELWYNGSRILTEGYFIIDDTDTKLIQQLGNRYYKQGDTGGKIALESKASAISHGRPSPDRADSLMLALCGKTVDDFKGIVQKTVDTPAVKRIAGDLDSLQTYMDHLNFERPQQHRRTQKRRIPFMSRLFSTRY